MFARVGIDSKTLQSSNVTHTHTHQIVMGQQLVIRIEIIAILDGTIASVLLCQYPAATLKAGATDVQHVEGSEHLHNDDEPTRPYCLKRRSRSPS